ncbi:MAG: universal stress protein [Myxococcales bacterium]
MLEDKSAVFVVGVDFGPRADDALITAFHLAEYCPGARIHAVLVIDPRDVVPGEGESRDAALERVMTDAPLLLRRRAQLACAAYMPEGMSLELSASAVIGKPAAGLTQAAIERDADLLIVGTQDRGAFARMLRPSVAARLAREAPCPVLIARPKRADAKS